MRTQHQSKRELDKIDRNILRILQNDGRISFTELGEKVGLSTTPAPSACAAWSAKGSSWATTPAQSAAPQGQPAGVRGDQPRLQIRRHLRRVPPRGAEAAPRAGVPPGVGDFDYLVKARISEMASYRKLLGDILLKLPHVRESKSYIVMEEVKESLCLPIPD
jgi:Lrp/AsnC family leucine-responsive transcriptional regulator